MPTGPSTSTSPYLLASEPNVRFVSIATVGDQLPDGSLFGGIPDGLGAYDNGDGTITVLVNHEFRPDRGIVRDHGSAGAYVDKLVIDSTTLEILSADDLIKQVQLWNDSIDSYVSGTTAFNRFCSSDLPELTAFYNPATGLGTSLRIYLTGEEAGDEGRAFATVVTGESAGTAYELPFLGNLSFENVVASPFAQDKTLVALLDDQGGGQVYLYVGQKSASGNEIDKAGLSGGGVYGIKVAGIAVESNGTIAQGTFTLQEMGASGDVSNLTGSQLQGESVAEGVTAFLRPEDGAWDPDNPNVFYFATTNGFNAPSRLYKLTFSDIANPQAGGTIEAVLDGTEGQQMLDNLSVANGKVILQEDPGNQSYLARVWEYDIASDTLSELARFDPAQFVAGTDGFITQDEESSGVIDVTAMLGDADTRAYLLDAQVHASSGNPATVEKGQLLAMYVDDPHLVGGNGNDRLFGSAADEALTGGNGEDVLLGGGGADSLSGGNGKDILVGGAGDDVLSGGNGKDMFVFDNRVATGADQITDFAVGDLVLTTVALTTIGTGRVDFGADRDLDLFGQSNVTINGGAVDSLRYAGTVTIDGTLFYAYGLQGGELGQSASAFDTII